MLYGAFGPLQALALAGNDHWVHAWLSQQLWLLVITVNILCELTTWQLSVSDRWLAHSPVGMWYMMSMCGQSVVDESSWSTALWQLALIVLSCQHSSLSVSVDIINIYVNTQDISMVACSSPVTVWQACCYSSTVSLSCWNKFVCLFICPSIHPWLRVHIVECC